MRVNDGFIQLSRKLEVHTFKKGIIIMSKTLMQKLKIGTLGLLSIGLLAACNTTDEYEENPDMGPPSATEEPADEDVEDLPTDGDDVEEDAS